MLQAKACRFDYLLRPSKKDTTIFVRFELEHNLEANSAAFGGWILFNDFSAFNKREVRIELPLEDFLMVNRVRPIKMITDNEHSLLRHRIEAQDIDYVWLVH